MDLGKHVCDIAPEYSTWRLNRVKDMVLPPIDDMVQSINLLPKRMPTKVEILIFEFEAKRKAANKKILRL